ncbi:MAG: GNAT family N-acetyltransferase [Candidatus Methanomethylophilaceae archaeon]|nr:GNAT family N-acetyltransferase [Candidatus Methanomethylophilaceae archaeon]
MEKPDLSTQRLIIRRFTLDDAEEMFDLARDPMVGRMAGWPPHVTIDDSIDFIEKGMDREDLYGLFSRTTGRMVGCIELFREPNILRKGPKDAEIGYWIGSRYWNQGYATEALGRLLEYAVATGVPKVWAQCLTNNPASARVLIKCGFKLDHRSLSENPMLGEVIVDFYSLSFRRRARRCT